MGGEEDKAGPGEGMAPILTPMGYGFWVTTFFK